MPKRHCKFDVSITNTGPKKEWVSSVVRFIYEEANIDIGLDHIKRKRLYRYNPFLTKPT